MVSNLLFLSCITFCLYLWSYVTATDFGELTQDQTSPRANTLIDNADDIQRQLDNEARDRIKYGRPKTIWVFHFPTQFPEINLNEKVTRTPRDITYLRRRFKENEIRNVRNAMWEVTKDWNYKDQNNWRKSYPECGGRSQSPVDLPYHGLIPAKAGRKLVFKNYDVEPEALKLINDGTRVTMIGKWKNSTRPFIYGGAAHSRRYIFHSITLHWPSEHTVGSLQYPMESQAMHLSAEYNSMEEALQGSISDPQAFLAVSTLYKYANQTHQGLADLIKAALNVNAAVDGFIEPLPLSHFSPPFKEYACYQGSMTAPPCTEAVLWLVRGRTLHVTREMVEATRSLLGMPNEGKMFSRSIQPTNDRKIYYFKS